MSGPSPRQRIQSAWDEMERKASDVADRVKDVSKERVDTELGIYLHKNVGTLFYFDQQVREYEAEIKRLAREGKKEEAMAASWEMQNYIMYEMKNNRRYKKRLSEIADKVERNRDRLAKQVERLDGSRLVGWLENRNTMDAEKLQERMGAD